MFVLARGRARLLMPGSVRGSSFYFLLYIQLLHRNRCGLRYNVRYWQRSSCRDANYASSLLLDVMYVTSCQQFAVKVSFAKFCLEIFHTDMKIYYFVEVFCYIVRVKLYMCDFVYCCTGIKQCLFKLLRII